MMRLWIALALALGLLLYLLLPTFPAVAQVSPGRPVVMVHGFNATWQAWEPYLGPEGYLASVGLQGFAVGDGQAPGVMETGTGLSASFTKGTRSPSPPIPRRTTAVSSTSI